MKYPRIKFTAFVAHGFAKEERTVAGELMSIFKTNGVKCTTADSPEVRQIPQKVMQRIREADALIAIVQSRGPNKTSRWVDQEIGYALGCSKPVLWFTEETAALNDGLEGKLEYVQFRVCSGKLMDKEPLKKIIRKYLASAQEGINDGQNACLFADKIYCDTSSVSFSDILQRTSKQLICAGIALLPVADHCQRQLAKKLLNDGGFRATLVLSDPLAPQPREREIDEKLEPPGLMAKDVAKIALRYLEDRDLDDVIKSGRLKIRFFSRYPTIAVCVFDHELYAYIYSYGSRGTESPLLYFRNYRRNKCAMFFWRHQEAVVKDSYCLPVHSLEAVLR